MHAWEGRSQSSLHSGRCLPRWMRAVELKGDEPRVPQTTEELEHAIAAVLRETHVPGAGVVLVSKDEVLWSAGIGLADRNAGRTVTPQTMFRLAGKASFVALATLKLQEEGKLRLEDRLSDLVGDVEFSNPWEKSDPLRLVHLLEHTSGFELSLAPRVGCASAEYQLTRFSGVGSPSEQVALAARPICQLLERRVQAGRICRRANRRKDSRQPHRRADLLAFGHEER